MGRGDKWLLQKATSLTVHAMLWSDHAPISISIADSPPQSKTNLWRTNHFLLQQPIYSKEIATLLSEFFNKNVGSVPDHSMVWSAHKAFVRGVLMQMNSHMKKERMQCLETITANMSELENINKISPKAIHSVKLLSLRQELRTLLLDSFEKMQRKLKAAAYSTTKILGHILY